MRALSDDLRLRIHEALQGGATALEAAERFGVAEVTVRRLRRRFRATGSLAPLPGGRGPAPRLGPRLEELRRAAAECPDATPAEHAERLGLGVSRWTAWRALRRLGLTFKKPRTANVPGGVSAPVG